MSIIVEKSRTETLAELTMRQANIRLIQRKVADLVQQNEKDINVIDEWMQMYHEGSTLIEILQLADEQLNIKKSQLVTICRLTEQAMEFLEEELSEKIDGIQNETTYVEALKLALEERDERLMAWNTQIIRMADRIQELEKMYETGAAMMQNPTEAVYLKCKLDATLNTLSQKQTQLTQKEQLSAQLLKMVEEQSEKRINMHHNMKLQQENYRLLACQNIDLKNYIDMLKGQLAEMRINNMMETVNEQITEENLTNMENQQDIPALNLEALSSRDINHEQNTQRIKSPPVKSSKNQDSSVLDIVDTDRQSSCQSKYGKRTSRMDFEEPRRQHERTCPNLQHTFKRSKSIDIIGDYSREATSMDSIFDSLRKWAVTGRLRRKKLTK